MDQQEQIQNLVEKAAAGNASTRELQELAEKLQLDHAGEVTRVVEEFLNKSTVGSEPSNRITDWKNFARQIIAADTQTQQQQAPVRSIYQKSSTWVRYAAAVIIIAGIGAYLWNIQTNTPGHNAESAIVDAINIQPGTDRATLTLADGRTIDLDSAGNGRIAEQSGSNIVKDHGQIVYENAGANGGGSNAINTMSTPRGGQYKLTLSDGTKVWLNAESSISYPAAFVGKDRRVNITGEVYFEVVKDKSKPFKVSVLSFAHSRLPSAEIEVLGTHFNINSYGNEASTKTTLLEGSVRIIRAGPTTGVAGQPVQTVILKPGEQAQLDNTTTSNRQIKVIRQADLEQTMAWKNGIFDFNGMDIEGVLRQIERWYDVQVEYERTPAAVIFKGEMYRNVHLADVLEKIQEMSGVKFRMEGKKLIVL